MLVLARRVDERILIGDDIEVIVVEIEKGKVRLGIIAPREIKVLRDELVPHRADNCDASNGEDA